MWSIKILEDHRLTDVLVNSSEVHEDQPKHLEERIMVGIIRDAS
jgi:hypothetical protein